MVQNRFTATGFVFNDDGEILMIKHKKLKKWMPPGGHVDENELPCEAALREIFEETGVSAKIISATKTSPLDDSRCRELPLPMEILLTNFEGDGLYNCINLNYICHADSSALKPEESEVEDIGWFFPAQIMEMDTFSFVCESVKKAVDFMQTR